MIKGSKINFLVIIVSLILCFSCKNERGKPDVSTSNVDLRVLRFDVDLFNSNFEKFADSLPFFRAKYGEFFDLYNFKIINIGASDNPAYPSLLTSFVTDFGITKLNEAVKKDFSDFTPFKSQLTEGFKYFQYYFPKVRIPVVVTYISGLNQSVVTTDTLLGIGLDKYLGANSEFYARMGIPKYKRDRMTKDNIPYDCMRGWLETNFPMSDSSANLLSHIIYQGKIIYSLLHVFPEAHDSMVTGFSREQIEWCVANEKRMWPYLVENKILFKSDYLTISKYINDAPFTKDFGRHSPGRAVLWIGYKIVAEYMGRNSSVSLEVLMQDNDYHKILQLSKYKP